MHLARIQGKGAQTPQRGKSERCDGLMADAHMCRRPRRKLGSQHAPLSPFRIPPQHSGSAPARCGALGLRAKCCSCECSGKFQSKRGRFKVCKGLRKGVVVGPPRSGNRSDASSDVHTCCIVADPHCCPEVPGSATIGDGAPKPFVCPFGVLMWLWYGPADSGGRATCAAAGASMVQRVKGGCRLNRSLSTTNRHDRHVVHILALIQSTTTTTFVTITCPTLQTRTNPLPKISRHDRHRFRSRLNRDAVYSH